MATKRENEQKKSTARDLYMLGYTLGEISQRIGVSENSLSRWSRAEGWKTRKTARGVTRKELVIKNLEVINTLLEKLNNLDDTDKVGRIVDQICKLSATIEKLDKNTNAVTVVEVFTALNEFLRQRMENDEKITPELLERFTYYQELYINESLKDYK